MFAQRLVNSLFPDDNSIVLFNNAVNTHKLYALKFVGGRASYVAVDRSIADQMADQRKNNIFFRFGLLTFTIYKVEKLYKFRTMKRWLLSNRDTEFIETTFEKWVTDGQHRAAVTRKLIGCYNQDYEGLYFHPSQSQKNIGISKQSLSKLERSFFRFISLFIR